jgi:hypothetical protein
MWWECGECGVHFVRDRPPAVCHECGTAGAAFVEVSPELNGDEEPGSLRELWLRAGAEGHAFHSYADIAS